ncbi:MAG TPA: hypothetical protein VIU34_32000 [Steroidobacter sp.]
MDRAIVISTLLLVGLTWLLYKLAVVLAGDSKPAEGASGPNAGADGPAISFDDRGQKPIHQRLRK